MSRPRARGRRNFGLRPAEKSCVYVGHAVDYCSIVLEQPIFFLCGVQCGVQDGGVQDGGDLSRIMHDARTSPPIRPARREYKCSPFY